MLRCEGEDRVVSNHPPPLGSCCLDTLLCLWLSVPWKSFWKVTQNRMAMLPSVLELDLGAGGTWWLVSSGK